MNNDIEGIVLQYQPYREHDAIIHVLCKDYGILHIVCKGVQKIKSKNAAAIQPFTYARIFLLEQKRGSLQTLKNAEIIHSFRKIRESLEKTCCATYMCECVDVSHFDFDCFDAMYQVLQILETTKEPLKILCLFQSLMNRMHGIEPYVDGCVRCQSSSHIHAISYTDGGFICTKCMHLEDDEKTKQQLQVFRLFCKAGLEHYPILDETIHEISIDQFMDLYRFFYDYSGIRVKSIKFLKTVFALA